MATRPASYVCPACARGALAPQGTWATERPAGGSARRPRRRRRTEVVRPPTHGAGEPAATIRAELAGRPLAERELRRAEPAVLSPGQSVGATSHPAASAPIILSPPTHPGAWVPVAPPKAGGRNPTATRVAVGTGTSPDPQERR
jgi:hypothetical protein